MSGNSNLNATKEILATTLKGAYHLGASFVVSYGTLRFVPLIQTFSPISNALYLLSFSSHLCAFARASWACLLFSSIGVNRCPMLGTVLDLLG